MPRNFLGVLKNLGVNESFGLGRVLEISLTFIQKLDFTCLSYPLEIFISAEMRESAVKER
jgi:hypothetical protein